MATTSAETSSFRKHSRGRGIEGGHGPRPSSSLRVFFRLAEKVGAITHCCESDVNGDRADPPLQASITTSSKMGESRYSQPENFERLRLAAVFLATSAARLVSFDIGRRRAPNRCTIRNRPQPSQILLIDFLPCKYMRIQTSFSGVGFG